ncbi:MAG: hypothetical protein ACF8LK_01540 [Phycisphaerales bacterium JB041]
MRSRGLSTACMALLLGTLSFAPMLPGCERSPTERAEAVTELTWEPRFARLSDELQQLVTFREEYVGRLQMMDVADGSRGETADALRQALIDAQPQIESCLTAAAELDGTVPELRWGDESEVASGAHLERARARVQNTARLLRADAVRLWDEDREAEAWRRLTGVARISQHLLAQASEDHHQLGALVFYPVVYTAESLCQVRPEPGHSPESAAFLATVLEVEASLRPDEQRWRQAISRLRGALE